MPWAPADETANGLKFDSAISCAASNAAGTFQRDDAAMIAARKRAGTYAGRLIAPDSPSAPAPPPPAPCGSAEPPSGTTASPSGEHGAGPSVKPKCYGFLLCGMMLVMHQPLAGYLRVSHVGARKGDAFRSVPDQVAEIEAWAKARGHLVEILDAELDAKGSNSSRPVFREAVEGVKSGRFAGVVVAYQSRAGRDMRLMLDLWEEIETAGGIFYSARENVDGSTPAGRLHRNLLASIHQHELEERREGFERQRRSAVERGIWQRRQTPTGYGKDSETRKLVPDDRADEVRAAAADLLASTSTIDIAARMGMTPSGVRHMLRNRVYLGELKVGRHVNATAHEPILEVEIFEAVQAKLEGARRPRSKNGPALLAGLIRCASCGHVMTRGTSKGAPAYTCPTYHSGERCPAPASIACSRLDPYVEQVALGELQRLQARFSAGDEATELQRELSEARTELSAYLAAVDAAGIGAADAAAGMRARRERIEAAEACLRAARARAPMLPRIANGAEVWNDLNPNDRNELLRGVLACVAVRPAGRGRTLPVGERTLVLRYGARVDLPRRSAERPYGIVAIHRENLDRDDLLGVTSSKNPL